MKNNETTVLILSLLVTLGVIGGGLWWFSQRGTQLPFGGGRENQIRAVGDRISIGEKTLIATPASPQKQAGIEAIASGDYASAVANLEAALQINRNDPETLIYLNNARIGDRASYNIAVSVPLGTDLNGALEILRGVAQVQQETNQQGGINGVPLKVAIANDDNNPDAAGQIATALAQNQQILGVVGPYASDVTIAAGKAYNSAQLTAISPISTSVKLSGFSPYVFRTVPSDYVAARALANHMSNQLQRQNAAVFFNSQSSYSESLKSEFVTAVALGGGQVSSEFDLSNPNFNAAQSIQQAIQQGAEVFMLAPNTGALDRALQVVQVNRKNLPLLAGDDVYTLKTLQLGGENALDMVVAVPWHIDANAQPNFVRQSRQLWGGEVNWRTALSYDAAQALVAAIERNPTRAGVQQALSAADFSTTGASGVVRFLPSGDRNAPVQLVRIAPGNLSGAGFDFVPLR